LYTLEHLKNDRSIWKNIEIIPVKCSWCNEEFEIKYGTLYNVIRRLADGIYCCRICSGAARAKSTQEKYKNDGGKICKRCDEFKELTNFSSLPNPPFFRAECKRCHNYKPARQYGLYKDKAIRAGLKFGLTLDEFLLFWEKQCHYCNAQINTVRLELLESDEGYVSNNIVSSCRSCQKFKGLLSHKDFISLCNKISDNVIENGV